MGKDRARARGADRELLAEGQSYQKAGLPAKALESYRSARSQVGAAAEVRAESWFLEAFVHHALGEWDAALEAARESRALAEEAADPDLLAQALNAEAAVYYGRGDLDTAFPLYARMLELSTDPRVRGLALQNLGILHGRRGEADEAERRLEEAFTEFERAGDAHGKAHVLNNHAAMALEREDHERAEGLSRRAMREALGVGDLDLRAIASLNRAEALEGLGRLEAAEEAASIALGQFETSGNRWRRVACFTILGDLNARLGDRDLALRFWERGLALADDLGARLEAQQLRDRLGETERAGGVREGS